MIYNLYGVIYSRKNDYELAKEYYYKAIEINNANKKYSNNSFPYGNLGAIQIKQNESDTSITFDLKIFVFEA